MTIIQHQLRQTSDLVTSTLLKLLVTNPGLNCPFDGGLKAQLQRDTQT
jgi:hypothetical protein